MYDRSTACALTGLDAEAFRTLLRRNQLPSALYDQKGNLKSTAFSAFDVVLIELQRRLMSTVIDIGGLGPNDAAAVVSVNSPEIFRVFQIWAGRSRTKRVADINHSKDQFWIATSGANDHVAGTPANLAKFMAKSTPTRLFAVNVHEVLRGIMIRADLALIEFPKNKDD